MTSATRPRATPPNIKAAGEEVIVKQTMQSLPRKYREETKERKDVQQCLRADARRNKGRSTTAETICTRPSAPAQHRAQGHPAGGGGAVSTLISK